MSKERTKRKEEILWEKAQEIWKDWKVTISIIWFLCLATIGLIIFAIINWNTGFWRGGGFSGEVDAAMINSLVAIFVTVPITLLTGAGTILVTAYFNLQTQKIAIQSQRSGLRDKILEKRLEVYAEINNRIRLIIEIVERRAGVEEDSIEKQDGLNAIKNLNDYLLSNQLYLSKESKVKTMSFIRDLPHLNIFPRKEQFRFFDLYALFQMGHPDCI